MLKRLLLVSALVETVAGVALLVAPARVVELLLGQNLTSPPSLVLSRIAGVALLSIGITCWRAGVSTASEHRPLIAGLLLYNVAVSAVLLHAALTLHLQGIVIWPGIVLHSGLAIWCLLIIRA